MSTSRPRFDRRCVALLKRAVLLVAILSVAGCKKSSDKPHEEGVAVVNYTQQATWIRNFNPFFESQTRWPSTAGIYEPTVIFNRAKGKFVPWLAESWHWEDENHTLVLDIRTGPKWPDGKPLTPKDVAFTFRLMKKFDALDQSSIWDHIRKIDVRGQEVHFHFHHAYTLPALYSIGRQPIVAEHIWKHVKDPVKFADPNPTGSGPFNQVLSFKTQVYEIGANPDYWQKGKPGLKKLRMPAFGSNESQSLAIINGDIDWAASFLPAIDRIFVGRDPEHNDYFFPPLEGTVMLYANTKKAPFDDVDVRKALSHAIDRKMIARIAMQGYVRPADATALSDLYAKYHDQKVLDEEGDWTTYEPMKSEQMLDAAGLVRGPDGFRRDKNGKKLTVDLNCVVGWSDWIIASEIIVKNLRKIGIDVTLRTYTHGAWFNKLQMGDFQLSLSWSDGAATPYSFYSRQMSKDTLRPLGEPAENNWQRFTSEKADDLLTAFAATADEGEMLRLASDLQREFVRNAPTIPLFLAPTWGESRSIRVEGFPSKDNPYALLAPYKSPGQILVLVELRPAGTPPLSDNPGEGAPPGPKNETSNGRVQQKTDQPRMEGAR
jgi:peptide/nickel transport system substrate-binding protein